jgi:hypothetical protein
MGTIEDGVHLVANLKKLLADGRAYSLCRNSNGTYDVTWFDGLYYGVVGDTLAEVVTEALIKKKRLEDEYGSD